MFLTNLEWWLKIYCLPNRFFNGSRWLLTIIKQLFSLLQYLNSPPSSISTLPPLEQVNSKGKSQSPAIENAFKWIANTIDNVNFHDSPLHYEQLEVPISTVRRVKISYTLPFSDAHNNAFTALFRGSSSYVHSARWLAQGDRLGQPAWT